jgi:hypothetical protein
MWLLPNNKIPLHVLYDYLITTTWIGRNVLQYKHNEYTAFFYSVLFFSDLNNT